MGGEDKRLDISSHDRCSHDVSPVVDPSGLQKMHSVDRKQLVQIVSCAVVEDRVRPPVLVHGVAGEIDVVEHRLAAVVSRADDHFRVVTEKAGIPNRRAPRTVGSIGLGTDDHAQIVCAF